MKSIIATFLFLLIVNITLVSCSSLVPTWMKKGTYAEYEVDNTLLFFANGTSLWSEEGAKATHRWDCVESNETIAKLHVSLTFEIENGKMKFSTDIYVNTFNRSVYLLNGTLVGTTHLWTQPYPADKQEVVLWDVSPDNVTGVIISEHNSKPIFMRTVQGKQKIFIADGNGTIRGQPTSFVGLTYDFDTGLMTSGFLNDEATLLSLGIKDLINIARLANTNIYLGPREASSDTFILSLVVAVVAVPIIIFVGLYMRRDRKLKRKKSKRNNYRRRKGPATFT